MGESLSTLKNRFGWKTGVMTVTHIAGEQAGPSERPVLVNGALMKTTIQPQTAPIFSTQRAMSCWHRSHKWGIWEDLKQPFQWVVPQMGVGWFCWNDPLKEGRTPVAVPMAGQSQAPQGDLLELKLSKIYPCISHHHHLTPHLDHHQKVR